MKLKRSTQGLLIAALILGVGVAVYEGTIAPERQAQQEQRDRLFKFAALDVQQITIETSDQVLQFDRLETPLNLPLNQEGEFTTTDWQFVRLNSAKAAGDREEPIASPENSETPAEDTTESASPEAENPEAESVQSENSEPENPEPENSDPNNPDLENSDPENPEADSVQSENSEPENPETENPDPENSDPNNPETENPDPNNSDPENPEAEKSKTDTTESNSDTTVEKPIPARQAYIDYLFNAINGASSDRSISAPANRRAEYGLATPTLRLTIELKNGTRHTLEIGSRDFTQSFVYALLDTPKDATQLNVLLLPPDFINAFDRDLAAWDATQPLESELDLPDPAIEGETPPPTDEINDNINDEINDEINSEILKDPIYNPEPDNQPTLEPEPKVDGLDPSDNPQETGN
jgi:hypothetical protein